MDVTGCKFPNIRASTWVGNKQNDIGMSEEKRQKGKKIALLAKWSE